MGLYRELNIGVSRLATVELSEIAGLYNFVCDPPDELTCFFFVPSWYPGGRVMHLATLNDEQEWALVETAYKKAKMPKKLRKLLRKLYRKGYEYVYFW